MYDDFKVANYSRALLSPEMFGRSDSRLFSGDVIDGFTVTPGTGMQVILAPGNAFIRYGSAAVASARYVSLVNTFNLAIATADVSNPRIDVVVVYVDNSVVLPSGVPTVANLDGRGVSKAIVVKGTPNASPIAPNAAAIQAAVGAGNPYTTITEVRVNAGVSVIASDKLTDVRKMTLIAPDKIDIVAFRAIPTGTLNFTGVETSVTYSTIQYNFGNGYSATTGIFTAPVSGIYKFASSARVEAVANTRAFVSISVANSGIPSQDVFIRGEDATATAISRASGSWEVYLQAGGTVRLSAYAGSTTNVNAVPNITYFAGSLVSRTA